MVATMEHLSRKTIERQTEEVFSEPDADLAEAVRRDLVLDENPSLGLTLDEFDTKINGSAAARRPYPG